MTFSVLEHWTVPAPRDRRRLVSLLQGLLLLEVLAFTISTLPGVREGDGFVAPLDGWLQCGAYVTTAVLALLRPAYTSFDRRLWNLVGSALALRAAAFVLAVTVVRHQHPMPYPSIADGGWLAMCVLVLLALLALIRSRFHGLSRTVLLDGLIGACATASLALTLLSSTLRTLTADGTPDGAVVVNLLYPAFDALLLVVVLGVLLAYRGRPPLAVWVFGAGVAGFAVLDSAYLYLAARGQWHPGTPLSALSLVSTALIAFAAWAPHGRPNRGRRDYLPGILLPALLALVCLAQLLWAGVTRVPVASVVLSAVGVAVALARTALSFQDVRAQILEASAELPSTAELDRAIADGQLVLHYQPLVSLKTGVVVGVEALVRWQHPSRGLLLPEAFLDQVDRGGLTGRLTRTVLRQGLEQLASWRAAGHTPVMAVNLTVHDLLDHDFCGAVDGLLAQHDVPGSALVLELTEDVLLADPVRGREVMAQLVERGLSLHIDDYGTGYSTLGYLRDLPQLGGIKVDRSFVTGLDTDPRLEAIIGSTIGLSRALGIPLIAEGVETVEVRDRLLELGCELAQGYLFGRPVPAAQITFQDVVLTKAEGP